MTYKRSADEISTDSAPQEFTKLVIQTILEGFRDNSQDDFNSVPSDLISGLSRICQAGYSDADITQRYIITHQLLTCGLSYTTKNLDGPLLNVAMQYASTMVRYGAADGVDENGVPTKDGIPVPLEKRIQVWTSWICKDHNLPLVFILDQFFCKLKLILAQHGSSDYWITTVKECQDYLPYFEAATEDHCSVPHDYLSEFLACLYHVKTAASDDKYWDGCSDSNPLLFGYGSESTFVDDFKGPLFPTYLIRICQKLGFSTRNLPWGSLRRNWSCRAIWRTFKSQSPSGTTEGVNACQEMLKMFAEIFDQVEYQHGEVTRSKFNAAVKARASEFVARLTIIKNAIGAQMGGEPSDRMPGDRYKLCSDLRAHFTAYGAADIVQSMKRVKYTHE